MSRVLKAGFVTVMSVLLASPAVSGSLTVPNEFTANTPAVAAEVNANFGAVKAAVDDNDTRITTNATNIGTNTTGVSNLAGAVSSNTTAIGSNTGAIDSLTTAVGAKVNRAGDTMTGELTVPSLTLSSPVTGYAVVQAYGFEPQDSTTTWDGFATGGNGFRAITGGTLAMAAPVNVPEGATIIALEGRFYENSPTAEVSLTLSRFAGFSQIDIATISTGVAETPGATTVSDGSLNHTVSLGDVGIPAYYLIWEQTVAALSRGAGPGLYSARVVYTYTAP